MMIFVKESKDLGDKATVPYGRGGVGKRVGAKRAKGLVHIDQITKLQEADPVLKIGKLGELGIVYTHFFH